MGKLIMDSPTQLSLEQQFKLRVFQEKIQQLSQEETQKYLLQNVS